MTGTVRMSNPDFGPARTGTSRWTPSAVAQLPADRPDECQIYLWTDLHLKELNRLSPAEALPVGVGG